LYTNTYAAEESPLEAAVTLLTAPYPESQSDINARKGAVKVVRRSLSPELGDTPDEALSSFDRLLIHWTTVIPTSPKRYEIGLELENIVDVRAETVARFLTMDSLTAAISSPIRQ
jgi:hypothetical protein